MAARGGGQEWERREWQRRVWPWPRRPPLLEVSKRLLRPFAETWKLLPEKKKIKTTKMETKESRQRSMVFTFESTVLCCGISCCF